MPVAIPEWLNPPNYAGLYAQGLAQNTALQEANQRIAAEHERTQMEAQARADTTAKEAELAKARIATEAAYKSQQLGIAQQKIDQIAAINKAKTEDAAAKLSAQTTYAKLLSQGVRPEEALFQVPGLATPSNVAGLLRSKESTDYHKQLLAESEARRKETTARTQDVIEGQNERQRLKIEADKANLEAKNQASMERLQTRYDHAKQAGASISDKMKLQNYNARLHAIWSDTSLRPDDKINRITALQEEYKTPEQKAPDENPFRSPPDPTLGEPKARPDSDPLGLFK